VKEKSAFRCCRCQSIGIEVHHILPQASNGPDTFENAAPLCPSCHTDFGDNPIKRKEISHMRDWWYQQVERQYPDNRISKTQLDDINTKLEYIESNQNSGLTDLKTTLKNISNKLIDDITPETARLTASGIINTSSTSAAFSHKLADNVHANMHCTNCGTAIGLLIGSNNCPECKTPIN
jgi:hypothetical protein